MAEENNILSLIPSNLERPVELTNEMVEEKIEEILNALEPIIGEDGNAKETVEVILHVLTLPEDEFNLVAPTISQTYLQGLNTPQEKLAIAQQINAYNLTVEEYEAPFVQMIQEIDTMEIAKVKRDFLIEMIQGTLNAVNSIEGVSKRVLNVPIEYCNPDAKMPAYAHDTDSGMDVFALEDITIHPGETALVSTGIKVALPLGFELQVRPKSGRALKTKLRVANTPGTIDQGYRDEIKVIIENIEAPIKDITIDEEGKVTSILYGSDFTIGKGEKFAQLVLAEVPKVAWYEVDSVNGIGEDRQGGFGSTGLK